MTSTDTGILGLSAGWRYARRTAPRRATGCPHADHEALDPVPLAPALVAIALAAPAAADSLDGTVLAHDRVANVLVLTDKTVWPLATLTQPLEGDLAAGDRIEIDYDSNEDDGVQVIHSVTRLP